MIEALEIISVLVVPLGAFIGAAFLLSRHLRGLRRLQYPDAIRLPEDRTAGPSYERVSLRVNVASIWTNVLALLLISIVGLSQVGLDLWRVHSGEKTSLSTTDLEALLRSRLPDPEILQREHTEIVDAIRGKQLSGPASGPDSELQERLTDLQSQLDRLSARLPNGPDVGKPVVETSSALSWLMNFLIGLFSIGLLCFLAAIWAVYYFIKSNHSPNSSLPKSYRKFATATTIGSLLGLGGVVIFKDVAIVKDAKSLITINFPESSQPAIPPTAAEVHLHLYHRLLQHSIRRSASVEPDCARRVGPFVSGSDQLETTGQSNLKIAMDFLKERSEKEHLISISLLGSADKRDLTQQTARNFNSNAGLAQARIGVVRKAVDDIFGPDTVQVVPGLSGPAKIGTKVTAGDLAADRTVQICAFWGPKT